MTTSTLPVLMIVTSHAQLGATCRPAGLWAEELTTPYYALMDTGYDVALASPLGGKSRSRTSLKKMQPA